MAGEVFGFKSGRSIKNCDPQSVGVELHRIRAEQGKLTAENVLDAAKDEASPLHAAFEWDDSEAARLHRLNQARRLITSIRVLNAPVDGPLAAFVNVRTPKEGRTYAPTTEVLSDAELRVRFLIDARQKIEALERRYAHFSEVADLLSRLKTAVA